MMVASCSSFMVGPDRDAATAMGAPQDPFRSALASGYKSLGANQYAEADYVSADIYYRKALDAGAGKAVPLEDPAKLRAPDEITDPFVALAAADCKRHGEMVRAIE